MLFLTRPQRIMRLLAKELESRGLEIADLELQNQEIFGLNSQEYATHWNSIIRPKRASYEELAKAAKHLSTLLS